MLIQKVKVMTSMKLMILVMSLLRTQERELIPSSRLYMKMLGPAVVPVFQPITEHTAQPILRVNSEIIVPLRPLKMMEQLLRGVMHRMEEIAVQSALNWLA